MDRHRNVAPQLRHALISQEKKKICRFVNPHFYLEEKKLQLASNQSEAHRLILLLEALPLSEVVCGIKQQLLDPCQRTAENNTSEV